MNETRPAAVREGSCAVALCLVSARGGRRGGGGLSCLRAAARVGVGAGRAAVCGRVGGVGRGGGGHELSARRAQCHVAVAVEHTQPPGLRRLRAQQVPAAVQRRQVQPATQRRSLYAHRTLSSASLICHWYAYAPMAT